METSEKAAIGLGVLTLLLACLAVWSVDHSISLPDIAASLLGRTTGLWADTKNVLEGVAGNAVFFALGTLFGAWSQIRRSVPTRKRVRAANLQSFKASSLMVVSGSRFELTASQLPMRILPDEFRIAFPTRFAPSIKTALPSFVLNEPVVSPRIAQLMADVEAAAPDFSSVYRSAVDEVAEEFVARARRSDRLFNGQLFHVLHVGSSATHDEREDPIVSIDFYKVDFFTHQVVHRMFRRMKESYGELAVAISSGKMTNPLRFFLNGFGLNCLVCACADRGRLLEGAVLVFGRRSERVSRNQATGTWHVTANEALSQTDVEDQQISLDRWIRRALHEESGIQAGQIVRTFIFNVCIAFGEMQPGMCCLCFCEVDLDALQSRIVGSQDGSMEYDAYSLIAFDEGEIGRALKAGGIVHEHKLTPFSPSAENILRNILARGTRSFAG